MPHLRKSNFLLAKPMFLRNKNRQNAYLLLKEASYQKAY
jgi:hypothetical protein